MFFLHIEKQYRCFFISIYSAENSKEAAFDKLPGCPSVDIPAQDEAETDGSLTILNDLQLIDNPSFFSQVFYRINIFGPGFCSVLLKPDVLDHSAEIITDDAVLLHDSMTSCMVPQAFGGETDSQHL